MQQVREIALRNGESNKLEARSERRLSDGESQELTVLLDQIAAHYPHQTFGEETGEIWREAFEMLAAKYGTQRLRAVLTACLIKPGQRFFPHPAEAAEDLEVMMQHERKTREQANPKPNCTVCEGSMWVVNSAKTARPMPIVASAGTGGSRDSRLPAVDRSAIAARLSKSAGNYFACPSGNERRKMVPFLPRT